MDVLFVVMPFGPILTPSLGVSILQSHLEKTGLTTKALYASFDYARLIGLDNYISLQESGPGLLLGEYCFADLAFPDTINETFQEGYSRYGDFFKYVPTALHRSAQDAKSKSFELINIVANKVESINPKIVICSSMFQQNLASLALINSIKSSAKTKGIRTIMGGCNTEYSLGLALLRRCQNLDFVCSGSGEHTLPKLCKESLALSNNQSNQVSEIEGVYHQPSLHHYSDVEPVLSSMTRGRMADLNESLPPKFYDYFDQVFYAGLGISPAIPVESSRGCWWGIKSHCTFCGLNGDDLSFKQKDHLQVSTLIKAQSKKYDVKNFTFVDNIIPRDYFSTLLPALEGTGFNLFYETKANLTKDQIFQFKKSGVNHIQPGIESLLDEVLQIMRKGTTQLINLECLKFCAEYSIIPGWSILWGFPGEDPSLYAEYLELIPKIIHFYPPGGMVAIRFDKFSPYQLNPAKWGLNLQPLDAYHFLYPTYKDSLNDIAYFFRHSELPYHPVPFLHSELESQHSPVYSEVFKQFIIWKQRWHDHDRLPKLELQHKESGPIIFDSRSCNPWVRRPILTKISSLDYLILNSLETKLPFSALLARCLIESPELDEEVLQRHLDQLIAQNWVVCSKKQYLSLVNNSTEHQYNFNAPYGHCQSIKDEVEF